MRLYEYLPGTRQVVFVTCALTLIAIAAAWRIGQDAINGGQMINAIAACTSALIVIALAAVIYKIWIMALRTERERRAESHRYESLVGQSEDLIIGVDVRTRRIVDVNAAAARRLDARHEDLCELQIDALIVDDSGELLEKLLAGTTSTVTAKLRGRRNSLLETEITVSRSVLKRRPLATMVIRDVTLRKKIETQLVENQQRLDRLAHRDQLTSLPNRLYLTNYLPRALSDAQQSGSGLAILFIDLDHFKHVNDSRGHDVGDKLLQAVAQRLTSVTRETDTVVRMGGDEFVVVMPDLPDMHLVNKTAANINRVMSTPVIVEGHALTTTASIGVSMYPRDGDNVVALLKHSDTAMYQAKDSGRNNCQSFSPAMDRKLKERVAIEAGLRNALKMNQLTVHYQPIINTRLRRVIGLEALLRWQHPKRGTVSAARFIPVAEETGLIVPIGAVVLQQVLADMRNWGSEGAKLVPVSINVSAVQLKRPEFASELARAVADANLPPGLFQLELTEGLMINSPDARGGEPCHDVVEELRERGFRIAIDDFGTGYSSLTYLQHWRVDCLKIDRSFVRDIVTDPNDYAIVSAITTLARHLEIQVVAEGVESWQQSEKLRELGCDLAQGFLFARPAPASACSKLLAAPAFDVTEVQYINTRRTRRLAG